MAVVDKAGEELPRKKQFLVRFIYSPFQISMEWKRQ